MRREFGKKLYQMLVHKRSQLAYAVGLVLFAAKEDDPHFASMVHHPSLRSLLLLCGTVACFAWDLRLP